MRSYAKNISGQYRLMNDDSLLNIEFQNPCTNKDFGLYIIADGRNDRKGNEASNLLVSYLHKSIMNHLQCEEVTNYESFLSQRIVEANQILLKEGNCESTLALALVDRYNNEAHIINIGDSSVGKIEKNVFYPEIIARQHDRRGGNFPPPNVVGARVLNKQLDSGEWITGPIEERIKYDQISLDDVSALFLFSDGLDRVPGKVIDGVVTDTESLPEEIINTLIDKVEFPRDRLMGLYKEGRLEELNLGLFSDQLKSSLNDHNIDDYIDNVILEYCKNENFKLVERINDADNIFKLKFDDAALIYVDLSGRMDSLVSGSNEATELRLENKSLHEKCGVLEEERDRLSDKVGKLTDELDELNKYAKSIEKRDVTQMTTIGIIQSAVDSLFSKKKRLEEEKAELEGKYLILEKTIEETTKIYENKISLKEDEIKSLGSINKDLESELLGYKSKNQQLTEERDDLSRTNLALNNQIESDAQIYNQNLSSKEDKINDLSQDKESLISEKEDLTSQLQRYITEKQELTSQIEKLNDRLEKITSEFETYKVNSDSEIKGLNTRIFELGGKTSSDGIQIVELTNQKSKLEEKYYNLRRNIYSKFSVEVELESLSDDGLIGVVEKHCNDLDSLRSEIINHKEYSSVEKEKLVNSVFQLQEKLDSALEENGRLSLVEEENTKIKKVNYNLSMGIYSIFLYFNKKTDSDSKEIQELQVKLSSHEGMQLELFGAKDKLSLQEDYIRELKTTLEINSIEIPPEPVGLPSSEKDVPVDVTVVDESDLEELTDQSIGFKEDSIQERDREYHDKLKDLEEFIAFGVES